MKDIIFWIFVFVFIVGVLLLVSQKKTQKKKTRELHVVIVGTDPDKSDQLLASLSKKKGYKVHARGMGEEWDGYGFKLRHTLKVAKELKPDDILMHLDAYDTYVLTDAYEILDKFEKMDANIVVSTEVNLAPNPEMHPILPIMENIYPTAPTRFRWINSGTYLGYAGSIVNVLSSMPPNFHCDIPTGQKTDNSDDQRCFHTAFLREGAKHNMKLDYNQDIFHCMWDVHHYSLKPKRIQSETGSMPCIIHGNGPPMPSYQEVVKTMKSTPT